MIEIVTSCLIGAICGAITSPFMHKWLTKKLSKKISLSKKSYMRIFLPNGLMMTIWDSTIKPGEVCACVHKSDVTKVTDGEIVYFSGTKVSRIRGNNFSYDRKI